jgi:hypothetical protein
LAAPLTAICRCQPQALKDKKIVLKIEIKSKKYLKKGIDKPETEWYNLPKLNIDAASRTGRFHGSPGAENGMEVRILRERVTVFHAADSRAISPTRCEAPRTPHDTELRVCICNMSCMWRAPVDKIGARFYIRRQGQVFPQRAAVYIEM